MSDKKKDSRTKDWLKIAVLVIAILTGLAYTGNAWLTYSRGIPDPNGREREEFGEGRPRGERPPWPQTQEERQERFNQMANELNLTLEQRDQITELWQAGRAEGPDGWRDRREQMQSILTPQQQAQIGQRMQARGQQFMNRRLEEAKRKLPPDQYKRFEERMKERANQFRGRRGGPGGGRGGGPGGGRGPGGS